VGERIGEHEHRTHDLATVVAGYVVEFVFGGLGLVPEGRSLRVVGRDFPTNRGNLCSSGT